MQNPRLRRVSLRAERDYVKRTVALAKTGVITSLHASTLRSRGESPPRKQLRQARGPNPAGFRFSPARAPSPLNTGRACVKRAPASAPSSSSEAGRCSSAQQGPPHAYEQHPASPMQASKMPSRSQAAEHPAPETQTPVTSEHGAPSPSVSAMHASTSACENETFQSTGRASQARFASPNSIDEHESPSHHAYSHSSMQSADAAVSMIDTQASKTETPSAPTSAAPASASSSSGTAGGSSKQPASNTNARAILRPTMDRQA